MFVRLQLSTVLR